MKIELDDGTIRYLVPQRYTPIFKINYNLVLKSDGLFRSIDRGVVTDRYASSMTFTGERSVVDNIYHQFQLLRESQKTMKLSDMEERYFGEQVISTTLDCVVSKIDKLYSSDFNVKSFKVEFLSTDTPVNTSQTLPTLTCLGHTYEGYNKWKADVVETYNRHNYFVDREADVFLFKGDYYLCVEDLRELMGFWVKQRGRPFIIQEADFGITNMFGPNAPSGTHSVIIEDIKYDRDGPLYRNVTIKLWRV